MVSMNKDERRELIRDFIVGAAGVLLNYGALFLITRVVGQRLNAPVPAGQPAGPGAPPFNVYSLTTGAALPPFGT